ncbi:ABC transporter permease [Geothrix sp. PMB-07]|uniref:ABC transporter permease n=1 Tax=Geothrix sp. PMB-07 TaxID=3068640 RepID=UPI0027412B38|nr:ABC transporter permease [Geothrix sp. PMB-07]WLT31883.1 ABC transporter permease [Geothrix sp. PMB-07]
MSAFLFNLRWAFRSLLRAPAFSLMVVLTLGLGIGANTTVFSLMERRLFRSMTLPDPSRVMVVTEFKDAGFDNLSWPDYQDVAREVTTFSATAAVASGSVNLTGDGEPERVRSGRVTWRFFEVAGIQPFLGRGFSAAEGELNGPKAVVLTHGFWKRRFGSDVSLVGHSIRLDGEDVPVIGILPATFRVPYQVGSSEVFVPLRLTPVQQEQRGSHFLGGIGRVKPGVDPQAARREVEGIIQRLAAAYPGTNAGHRAKVVPMQEEATRNARPLLLALTGAVLFVLLIACANVANLIMARSAAREREVSIRAALGAGRSQLVAQMLTEAALLALGGAAAGLLVARYAMVALQRIIPPSPLDGPPMDGTMVSISLVTALVSVFLFALLPAWQASRVNLESSLREGAKGTGAQAQKRMRRALVTAEVALATTLLAGAGLMIRSVSVLQQVDPGFRAERVLTAAFALPRAKYGTPELQRGFAERLLRRAKETPGVLSAAVVDTLPLGGSTSTSTYQLDGQVSSGDSPHAQVMEIGGEYFEALGIPLLRGRSFQGPEAGSAVVSAAFANRHWPGQDPTGRRLSFDGTGGPWLTIIGVAGDVRARRLAEAPGPQVYLPMQNPTGGNIDFFTLVLRGDAAPESLIPGLKAAMRDLDPDLPASQVRSMPTLIAQGMDEYRAQGVLFGAFGLVALLLSAVGVYGVTSFLVAQRRREIGIRMALGAQIRDVLALIVGQGARTLGLGLLIGLAAALLLGRLLQAQLYGVTPQDPAIHLLVLAVLGLIGLTACLIPALRAARVDPSQALRAD